MRGSRKRRVPSAPAARVRKNAHGRHHRYPGTPGASCAMVLTAYAALSLATNSSCHHRRRIERRSCPVGRSRLRRLSISNGCQDHTVLPSTATFTASSTDHVPPTEFLAKVLKRRSSARRPRRSQRKPCPTTAMHASAAASTASHPASVTTRDPPSVGGTAHS